MSRPKFKKKLKWKFWGGGGKSFVYRSKGKQNQIFTSFSRSTLTIERSNPVMASGSIETSCTSTIIDVFTTIWAWPSIDTNTGIASDWVDTSSSIFAYTWPHRTLIYIFTTVCTCRKYLKGYVKRCEWF